jgi:hypothetical protein
MAEDAWGGPDGPPEDELDLVLPLDANDPRFEGSAETPAPQTVRRLERSLGPGTSSFSPRVRILRAALPVVVLAGFAVTAAIFWVGLDPPSGRLVVGDEAEVRAAVAERPRRVCLNDVVPCAWLTVVDGRLLAFNTAGPLREEYGRAGVSWCPTSGHYGSNSLGSRFDQLGRVVRGPAPRGLDRFGLRVDDEGRVIVNFLDLTTGLQQRHVGEVLPPWGPDCDPIPFDREADLELPAPG